MPTIYDFINTHFEQILEEWQSSLQETFEHSLLHSKKLNLEQHCKSLLTAFCTSLAQPDPANDRKLIGLLTDVGNVWATKGVSASQTSKFIITLKQTLSQLLCAGKTGLAASDTALFNEIGIRLDELLLHCHDAYTRGREKLISQQGDALLELSSPVVKMWDKILLLPLIGVIDTSRAKQITESLLTEIARLEALVAVMDLTGVPIFDTAVAGHLIKTVNAAKMLGCKVVMTGVSPEGALVLTKLGIEFDGVITRGNLHQGVQTAFLMSGLQVAPVQGHVHAQ